jgi:hypothetical protein
MSDYEVTLVNDNSKDPKLRMDMGPDTRLSFPREHAELRLAFP